MGFYTAMPGELEDPCEHPEEWIELQIDQYAGEIEFCTQCWTTLTDLGFLSNADDFYQQKVDDAIESKFN